MNTPLIPIINQTKTIPSSLMVNVNPPITKPHAYIPYLSKFGLLKVHKLKTYVFTPHDLNTQEMETSVYHEIS
jgi:predicted transcriptional regulator